MIRKKKEKRKKKVVNPHSSGVLKQYSPCLVLSACLSVCPSVFGDVAFLENELTRLDLTCLEDAVKKGGRSRIAVFESLAFRQA